MHSISFIFAKSHLGLLTSCELVVLCLVHSCHLSHLFTINLGILSPLFFGSNVSLFIGETYLLEDI